MAVISDQNRAARLDALATGGTPALGAYDDAQAAIKDYQSNAIGNVANQSAVQFGGLTGEQNNAIAGLVGQYTAPAVSESALAGQLASAQGGYDEGAYNAYLANIQKGIDLDRYKQSQEIGLDQYASSMGLDLLGASHTASMKDIQASNSQMNQSMLDQYIQGAGQLAAQEEARRNSVANTNEQERVSSDKRSARYLADKGAEVQRSQGQNQAQGQQLDPAANGTLTRRQIEQDLPANRSEKAQLQQMYADIQKRLAAQTSKVQSGQQKWEGNKKVRQSNAARREVNPNFYNRSVAGLFGIDPIRAAGMFPDDPGDMISRSEDRRKLSNLQQYGTTNPDELITQGKNRAAAVNDQTAADLGFTDTTDMKGVSRGANLSVPKMADLMKSEGWSKVSDAANAGLSAGLTYSEFMDAVRKDFKDQPEMIRLAGSYYKGLYSQSEE